MPTADTGHTRHCNTRAMRVGVHACRCRPVCLRTRTPTPIYTHDAIPLIYTPTTPVYTRTLLQRTMPTAHPHARFRLHDAHGAGGRVCAGNVPPQRVGKLHNVVPAEDQGGGPVVDDVGRHGRWKRACDIAHPVGINRYPVRINGHPVRINGHPVKAHGHTMEINGTCVCVDLFWDRRTPIVFHLHLHVARTQCTPPLLGNTTIDTLPVSTTRAHSPMPSDPDTHVLATSCGFCSKSMVPLVTLMYMHCAPTVCAPTPTR